MANGIWPSVSGAIAQEKAVDTVANNLANLNTLGYKKDEPTFKEYLATIEREKAVLDIPRGPIKDKDLYPIDGRDQSFVVNDGTYTNFKQGSLQVTRAPLDLALDGKGFFEVSTPNGIRYTRHGGFKLARDGQLVTTQGYPVLASIPGGLATAQPGPAVQFGQGGQATQGGVGTGQTPQTADLVTRFINLSGFSPRVSITEAGEIFAGDELVAQLAVTEFRDRAQLTKEGGQFFLNRNPANVSTDPGQTKVRQGMLETSNVNPAEEMTKLIKAQRMFEHDLKAMRTYDELMQKEVNEVGKL